MTPDNRAALQELLIGTAVRLAIKGLIAEALVLAPAKRLPTVMARILFRVALPGTLRTRVKALVGR
jgi:hypothetical protein